MIQISLPEELTPEMCQVARDIMCTGIPGIGYWVSEITEAGPYFASKHDKPNQVISFIEEDTGKEFTLTERQVLQGAIDCVLKGNVNAEIRGWILANLLDADEPVDEPTADCIIQMAALGEVRYG